MSVIAGCSLFNGVLLLADCRATVTRRDQASIYVDNVQKLFVVTPQIAFGFVGDILAAAAIFQDLPRYMNKRLKYHNGLHPVTFLDWFPRYLQYAYSRVQFKPGPLSVMVACIIRDHPNVIERAKVVALMERFRLGKLSYQRSWLPEILIKILNTPPEVPLVRLLDAPLGILGMLASPQFDLELLNPLEFGAIGSGETIVSQIDKEADWIFAGDVGNPFIETMALRECASHFIADNNIPTVGGLFPCVKLEAAGLQHIGESVEIPLGGDKIELKPINGGRWLQRHVNSGTEIQLRYPWEIDFANITTSQTFDFLKNAQQNFHGRDRKDVEK